jgi:hypothetical protein
MTQVLTTHRDIKAHVTLLDKLGVPVEKFGDSTGRLNNNGDALLHVV